MKSSFIAVAVFSLGWVQVLGLNPAWAQEPEAPPPAAQTMVERVAVHPESHFELSRYKPFHTRLGLGATLAPDTFLILANVEYQMDRFFAVGPQMELGLSSDLTLFSPGLGGRLVLPIYPWRRVELSLSSAVGVLVRSINGLTFYDFVYSAGLNADVYINRHVSVGAGWIFHVTSSAAERTFNSVLASARYHF